VPTVTLAAPPPATGDAERLTRENLGFLLAKASQRWNDVLGQRFAAAGYPEVRPAYGSLLIPLFEEDGLRQGELARRARLSKQTMTTMARALERAGLVERRGDPEDGRATRLYLTARARAFRPVAAEILADLDERAAARLRIGRSTLESALRSLLEL
jgi:DNA-binding MarR family transcriptional regulator